MLILTSPNTRYLDQSVEKTRTADKQVPNSLLRHYYNIKQSESGEEKRKKSYSLFSPDSIHTHTHTHTYIYIYIKQKTFFPRTIPEWNHLPKKNR